MRRCTAATFVALACLAAVGTGTVEATPAPVGVGAFAPTTPGGLCLGNADYSLWTTKNADGKTGYDLFPTDLETCTEYCIPVRLASQSVVYDCGGFPKPSCGNLYFRCALDCITHNTTYDTGLPALLTPSPYYSRPCSSCFANITDCSVRTCAAQCLSGRTASGCQNCVIQKCDPSFIACTGLDPTPVANKGPDSTAILGGALGGVGALMVIVVFFGYRKCQRDSKRRQLDFNDLAKLAMAPGSGSNPNVLTDGGSFRGGAQVVSSNPGYQQQQQKPQSFQQMSPNMGGGAKTPYQLQYEMQQQQLAQGFAPSRQSRLAPPSARLSALVAQARVASSPPLSSKNTRLIAIYDFVGERGDELTVSVGARMTGIEEQDMWWLAKTDAGVVGLIPSTYVEVDRSTSVNLNPNF